MARVRRVFPPDVLKHVARAVAEELSATNPGYEVVPHVAGRRLRGAHHLPGAVEADRESLRDVRAPSPRERRGNHD